MVEEIKQLVVLVDDDQKLRDLTARYLKDQGLFVETVSNGAELDKILDSKKISLIVLDLMMPGESGLNICQRLRVNNVNIPIIMLTAKGDEVDRIVGLEMGADDYLPKPFNPRELLARINAILRRQDKSVAKTNNVIKFGQFENRLRCVKPLSTKEFADDIVECQNVFDSVHNVPKKTYKRMKRRFNHDVSTMFKTEENNESNSDNSEHLDGGDEGC